MNERISVIVPVYNAAPYLKKCLDSLSDQTHRDLEILLIDDGSTDQSAAICREYTQKDPRFILYQQKNQGVSAARNLGIEKATGVYIGFCDSDDWVEAEMYETLLSLLRQYQADVSIVSFITEQNGTLQPFTDADDVVEMTATEAICEMHLARWFEGQLCNKLFRRELFEQVRLDTSVAILEDLLALWQVFLQAQKVVFRDVHLYHYVLHTASALHRFYNSKDWNRRDACLKMQQLAQQRLPTAVPYVNKTFIMSDINIAEKMCLAHALTKADRLLLQKEVAILHTEQVDALLTPDRKARVVQFQYHFRRFCFTLKIKTRLRLMKHGFQSLFKSPKSGKERV